MVTDSGTSSHQTGVVADSPNRPGLESIRTRLATQVLGQQSLIDRLVIALLADGHLLVEGAPGLAKTRAIKALADCLDSNFHRIQFTPDLLPSDLTGTEIYQPETGTFKFQAGPVFHNIVLADEINRAPAKVQSALLEAMAERQVTIGKTTHDLPRLFMVMATQNPIEQEGTYPLPEAQLDRFLMHVNVEYPDARVEGQIMELALQEALTQVLPTTTHAAPEVRVSEEAVFAARREVLELYVSAPVREYISQLVLCSRQPAGYDEDLARWIEFGASPRGSISLERVSRAHAWLAGRDYVSPSDVQAMIHDTLRHRLILSFRAEAEGLTPDDIVSRMVELVPAP